MRPLEKCYLCKHNDKQSENQADTLAGQKKYREIENAFVAEGPKIVGDLLETRHAKLLVATQDWLEGKSFPEETEVVTATDEELRKVSFLRHPQQVLGVFPLPLPKSEDRPMVNCR